MKCFTLKRTENEDSALLSLDGIHITWKRDRKASQTSKGIQRGRSPTTSPTISTSSRPRILWIGWPASNKGELKRLYQSVCNGVREEEEDDDDMTACVLGGSSIK